MQHRHLARLLCSRRQHGDFKTGHGRTSSGWHLGSAGGGSAKDHGREVTQGPPECAKTEARPPATMTVRDLQIYTRSNGAAALKS